VKDAAEKRFCKHRNICFLQKDLSYLNKTEVSAGAANIEDNEGLKEQKKELECELPVGIRNK
jgi:hypothetical protein